MSAASEDERHDLCKYGLICIGGVNTKGGDIQPWRLIVSGRQFDALARRLHRAIVMEPLPLLIC
jgi:hypothetical protein